jgi:hypothetical protein
MKKKQLPEDVLSWLREIGAKGGNNRRKTSTPAQRRKWGQKGAEFGILGGRPRGSKSKKGKASK